MVFKFFFEHDQLSIVQQTSFDLVAVCEREIGESDTNNFKRYKPTNTYEYYNSKVLFLWWFVMTIILDVGKLTYKLW